MKNLSMLSLLVLSSCSIFSSDTTNYQGKLQAALAQRNAGDSSYDSSSENMRKIRDPRREQIGDQQEKAEYFNALKNMPGFVQKTPTDRFIEKIGKYFEMLKSGTMTPGEFSDIVAKKLATYHNSIDTSKSSAPTTAPTDSKEAK